MTFRSLIHLNFIFLDSVRRCSNFILLHLVVQFFQHDLLKRQFFFPLYILASFIKDKAPICVWVYLQTLYPVILVYTSIFVTVPYCLDDYSFVVLKSGELIPPAPSFFPKIALTI